MWLAISVMFAACSLLGEVHASLAERTKDLAVVEWHMRAAEMFYPLDRRFRTGLALTLGRNSLRDDRFAPMAIDETKRALQADPTAVDLMLFMLIDQLKLKREADATATLAQIKRYGSLPHAIHEQR